MRGLKTHQLVFCAVLGLVLAAAALEARTFRDVASWFPFYFSLVGVFLCAIGVGSGLLRWRKARREADRLTLERSVKSDGEDPEAPALADFDPAAVKVREDIATMLAGFRWFGLFLVYAAVVGLVGVALGSAIFITVWFRTVYPWPWRNIAMSLAVLLALGWLGTTVVDIELPPSLLL